MVVTVLNNGKLLKPQTLKDGKLVDFLTTDDNKSILGATQETSPVDVYENPVDWTAELITGTLRKNFEPKPKSR